MRVWSVKGYLVIYRFLTLPRQNLGERLWFPVTLSLLSLIDLYVGERDMNPIYVEKAL